ncbi:hypothetical protein GCM10029963_08720 [Micromonospora andamanensis]
MFFEHSPQVWAQHPTLVAGVLYAEGVAGKPRAELPLAELLGAARRRLDGTTEAAFAEIQAWRRAFGRMGLAPTRYRCASESLLRRLRTSGDLPRMHPLWTSAMPSRPRTPYLWGSSTSTGVAVASRYGRPGATSAT